MIVPTEHLERQMEAVMDELKALRLATERRNVETIAVTAEQLSCSPGHVRNLIKRGELTPVKLGDALRIPVEAIRALINDGARGQNTGVWRPVERSGKMKGSFRVKGSPFWWISYIIQRGVQEGKQQDEKQG